jgi:hypothetical protein
MYDSEEQVGARAAAHKTFIDGQIADLDRTLQRVATLEASLDAEQASITAFVAVPQYGDLRPNSTQLDMWQAMTELRLVVRPADGDIGPIDGEPALYEFLVRGDGDPMATSSEEHRAAQRIWKRSIYRRDIATVSEVRSQAGALKTSATSALEIARNLRRRL